MDARPVSGWPRVSDLHLLDIITYCGHGKLWTVSLLLRISIAIRDRTRTPVRAAQTVEADDKEPCEVERATIASHQRSPPVAHICAPGQGMADHQRVVPFRGEFPTRAIRYWDIVESGTGLESEGGDDSDLLVWYEGGERVLRLCGRFLYGI